MVRRQLSGLRSGQEATSRHRRRSAAPHQVQEVRARLAALSRRRRRVDLARGEIAIHLARAITQLGRETQYIVAGLCKKILILDMLVDCDPGTAHADIDEEVPPVRL